MDYVKEHMKKALANHRLAFLVDEPDASVFVMKAPNTGIYSITILESRGHLCLFGDLTIGGPHGCVSASGYGINWFSSQKSDDYLCSKFLEKSWHWEICEAELREIVSRAEELVEVIEAAKEMLSEDYLWTWGTPTSQDVYEKLDNSRYDTSDGIPGHGYDPSDAGWLVAVQRRFSELFNDGQIYESIEELNAAEAEC